jgi:L-amino acid N-acyltransferase YncA
MFVIANKTDYDEKDWAVTAQEGEAFSATIGATFIPMSAKTGDGTGSDLLAKMTKLILLRRIHHLSSSQQEPSREASVSVHSKILRHDYGQFWY